MIAGRPFWSSASLTSSDQSNIFPYFPHKCMFHYKELLLSQDTAELWRTRQLFCGLIKWTRHELDLRFKGVTELWA
ncbi:hypothetical protein MHYP_G00334600 [Metynnis hypsauchen]